MRFEPQTALAFADCRHRLGDYLPQLVKAGTEMLAVVHLGARGELIARRIRSSGERGAVLIPVRHLVCDALNLGSLSVLLAHNHPSGDPTPSEADIAQTRKLRLLLHTLDIELEDHLIVTRSGIVSMHATGLI